MPSGPPPRDFDHLPLEVLERAAFDECPFDIGVITVHSANPAGAAKIAQVLRRRGYRIQLTPGSPDVGYLDGARPSVVRRLRHERGKGATPASRARNAACGMRSGPEGT